MFKFCLAEARHYQREQRNNESQGGVHTGNRDNDGFVLKIKAAFPGKMRCPFYNVLTLSALINGNLNRVACRADLAFFTGDPAIAAC